MAEVTDPDTYQENVDALEALSRQISLSAPTDTLKAAKRTEIIGLLLQILEQAVREGVVNPGSRSKLKQRWSTIAAYTAQVLARLVKDLQYEQYQAEIIDLKMAIARRDISLEAPNTDQEHGTGLREKESTTSAEEHSD